MQLKIYQQNAIDELLEKAKRLLGYSGSKKLVFKSPTGSGKTIMMAEFLKRLVDDKEIKQPLSFIWTAPRHLHEQSKRKLEEYFENSRALKCLFFKDLDDRKIDENEILFFNWESINKKNKNTIVKENEQNFYLSKVLERTKEEGREIILIIDEIHHSAGSDISKGLIKMIGPKLTIGVSATPKIENPNAIIEVDIQEVKAEAMIKKAIMLNDKFINLAEKGKVESGLGKAKDSDKIVIDVALKKREELKKAYQDEGVKINPLILIQLPDRMGQIEDEMKNRVIGILKDRYNISTKNGKLAIWLSGEHINKEDIEKPDSEVEVLIFKQAIALGWDCPRAQILVLFRQWHSPIFSIQTVGRIMRMPEPTRGSYYKNDVLDYGYVYTNLSHIEIKEDIAHYITIYTSKRKIDPKLNLVSCYRIRHREKTRLTPLFIEVFLKIAKRYKLKKKIDLKVRRLDIKVFNDWKIENVDELPDKTFTADKEIKISDFDLQKLFDFFARKSLREGTISLYPEDRSVGRIKESIYQFFEKEFNFKRGEEEDKVMRIVLSDKNNQYFLNAIDEAKVEYQKEVSKREPEIGFIKDWNIPESSIFGEEYKQEEREKSIMQPFYTRGEWKSENAFIDFLERSRNIEWWFKNGDRDATFFAVPYNDGEEKPFYVDFIVKLRDGRIGLFDPHGIFLSDFKSKSDGLRKYIREQNKKGKNLFGGIVANTDSREYKGKWIYFNKPSKELGNDFANWEDLGL